MLTAATSDRTAGGITSLGRYVERACHMLSTCMLMLPSPRLACSARRPLSAFLPTSREWITLEPSARHSDEACTYAVCNWCNETAGSRRAAPHVRPRKHAGKTYYVYATSGVDLDSTSGGEATGDVATSGRLIDYPVQQRPS